MDLIDDAANRSARPVTLASDLPEIAREAAAAAVTRAENSDTGHILLDPKGDIPLKLYELDYSEIDKLKIRSWRPSLHLTPKEREIVETPGTLGLSTLSFLQFTSSHRSFYAHYTGTVCVLGRSGTGMYPTFYNYWFHAGSRSSFVLTVIFLVQVKLWWSRVALTMTAISAVTTPTFHNYSSHAVS